MLDARYGEYCPTVTAGDYGQAAGRDIINRNINIVLEISEKAIESLSVMEKNKRSEITKILTLFCNATQYLLYCKGLNAERVSLKETESVVDTFHSVADSLVSHREKRDFIKRMREKAENEFRRQEAEYEDSLNKNALSLRDAGFIIKNKVLKKYIGTETRVEIPFVTRIGKNAFKDKDHIASILIPNSVTKIESRAFYGCRRLENIQLPVDVNSIGQGAFQLCTSLKEIKLPQKLKFINDNVFRECSSLTFLEINKNTRHFGLNCFKGCISLENGKVDYKGNLMDWCEIKFENFYANPACYTDNLYIDDELIRDLEIPTSVIEISDFAFCGYKALDSVEIPMCVKKIGRSSFIKCGSVDGNSIYKKLLVKAWINSLIFVIISGLCFALLIWYEVTHTPVSFTFAIIGNVVIGLFAYASFFLKLMGYKTFWWAHLIIFIPYLLLFIFI